MHDEAAIKFVDRIIRQFDAGARPLAFDPTQNGSMTKISHRGFTVEVGVGRCEQGSLDLIVGVRLGTVPVHQRDSFLTQLLQWNHCTSGIGHFSLADEDSVFIVSRHGLGALDAEGLRDDDCCQGSARNHRPDRAVRWSNRRVAPRGPVCPGAIGRVGGVRVAVPVRERR